MKVLVSGGALLPNYLESFFVLTGIPVRIYLRAIFVHFVSLEGHFVSTVVVMHIVSKYSGCMLIVID